MCYLKHTHKDVMVLSADDSQGIFWHVNAALVVHNDKKSHTGAVTSLGGGAIISISTKQKVNTLSSTEAELVSIDDVISKVMWMKLLIKTQGFTMNHKTIMCDNISSMKLEMNGKQSSGKQMRHLDIKYF
jgi:uncharacterized protein YrrD